MKILKTYKQLFETGEWNSDVNLDYVLENPDCDEEECVYIKQMYESLNIIKNELTDSKIFDIIDIKGFDLYQGAYATVNIFDKNYEIWNTEDNTLWIEDFPIDNTSSDEMNAGFNGYEFNIVNMLNKLIEVNGNFSIFNDVGKYNL